MSMDADVEAAITAALNGTSPEQASEFRRRFRKLCENALVSNHNDSEVRRVLELVAVAADAEG